MPTTQITANEEKGTLTASTGSFTLKSGLDSNGSEREYVEGFLATTHIDKGYDEFTEDALKQMVDDINGKSVDAVFNNVDTEALREATVGNLDHNNNPASPFGDTRIVPAFKIVDAEVRNTGDGEKGLWIKSVLNTGGMLDETVSAVKNSIKDSFLTSFSIEFVPEQVKKVKRGEKVVRLIEKAAAKGAALTGRPMNPQANMTDAMLKSMATSYKVEYDYSIGSNVSWSTSNGRTNGTVRDRTKEACFNEEIDGDVKVCGSEDDPAYLIEIDNEEGTMVGHKQSSLSGKSYDKPEEEKTVNDIKPMTEEDKPDSEEGSESQDVKNSGDQGEDVSFSEDVKELKSTVDEIKSTNEELRDENEELKSKLEDLEELQEVKNDLDEVKGIVEEIELEDGPRVEQKQERFDEQETKAEWKQKVDSMPEGFLDFEGKNSSNVEAFAKNHGIKTEEVKNYVSSN